MSDMDKILKEIKKHIDANDGTQRSEGTGKAVSNASMQEMEQKMAELRKLVTEGETLSAKVAGDNALRLSSRRSRRKPNAVVLAIMFLMGAGCLWMGGKLTQDNLHLLDNGMTAQGKVLRVEARESSCNRGSHQNTCTKYVAIIGFTDDTGRPAEFETDYRSSRPMYSEGQDVEVIYIPDHPAVTAKINTTSYMWTVPGALGAAGLLLTLVPFFMFRSLRKEKERVL